MRFHLGMGFRRKCGIYLRELRVCGCGEVHICQLQWQWCDGTCSWCYRFAIWLARKMVPNMVSGEAAASKFGWIGIAVKFVRSIEINYFLISRVVSCCENMNISHQPHTHAHNIIHVREFAATHSSIFAKCKRKTSVAMHCCQNACNETTAAIEPIGILIELRFTHDITDIHCTSMHFFYWKKFHSVFVWSLLHPVRASERSADWPTNGWQYASDTSSAGGRETHFLRFFRILSRFPLLCHAILDIEPARLVLLARVSCSSRFCFFVVLIYVVLLVHAVYSQMNIHDMRSMRVCVHCVWCHLQFSFCLSVQRNNFSFHYFLFHFQLSSSSIKICIHRHRECRSHHRVHQLVHIHPAVRYCRQR